VYRNTGLMGFPNPLRSRGTRGDPQVTCRVPRVTSKALNPHLPVPLPHGGGCQDSPHGYQGRSVAHLSGSIATTKVVLLGKPAGHCPRELRLLHLQQGQQRVGCPFDVVGMGVAFLPTFAPWGDIGPSAPSRDDCSLHRVSHNYLSPLPLPPSFVPPGETSPLENFMRTFSLLSFPVSAKAYDDRATV